MTDEDLYQQAADELNSNRRHPDVWARACALASDDHDEARYLYTTLRVEELMAEREAADASAPATNIADDSLEDVPLALEPLEGEDDTSDSVPKSDEIDRANNPDAAPLALDSAVFEADQRNKSAQDDSAIDRHAPSERELGLTDEALSENDDFLDETINVTSELDGTAVFEIDEADAPAPHDLSIDHDEPENWTAATGISAEEELEALLDGAYDASEPGQSSAPGGEAGLTTSPDDNQIRGLNEASEEDLDWLEQELSASDSSSLPLADSDNNNLQNDSDLTLQDVEDFDQLADQVERQADQLPGLDDSITTPETVTELGFDAPETGAVIADGKPDSASDTPSSAHHPSGSGATGLDSIFESIEQQAEGVSSHRQAESGSDQQDVIADGAVLGQPGAESRNLSAGNEAAAYAQSDAPGSKPDGGAHETLAATVATAGGAAAGAAAGAAISRVAKSATKDGEHRHSTAGDTRARERAGRDTHGKTSKSGTISYPVDLTGNSTRGAVYEIFRRDGRVRAVRHGVSWSALVFTLPWLLYRHLFGTAAVYMLTWLILLTGFLVSGLVWLDGGSAASLVVKGATVGFGVLVVFGLLYLPFRHANHWRRQRLEQRGFEPVALVRDRSPGRAIAQARSASLLN